MIASTVDLHRQMSAGAEKAMSAVEQGLEVMRSVLADVKERAGRGSGADVSETIAPALVELVGYDSAAVWRVDGSRLVRVSVAFGARTRPSASELDRLLLNPPLLEGCPLEAALASDADVAATGGLGSGGPMEAVLGPLSYAVAAVKSRSNPGFLLQAMYCERRADQFDRDLLMSIAQLIAAVTVESGAGERPTQSPGRAGANNEDHNRERFSPSITAGRPRDDPFASGLDTLTGREREVLDHALTGVTYTAIADALFISVSTVHSHMRSILSKLGLHSRAALIARHARRHRGSLASG